MAVRPPLISLILKGDEIMATKKPSIVMAFILMLTLVSYFSLPVSVFANDQPTDKPSKEASITIEKTVDQPEVISKSGSVTYTFKVKNTGDFDLKDVTITDTDIGYSKDIGKLKKGDSKTETQAFDLSGLSEQDWVDNVFTNTASVSGTYKLDFDFDENVGFDKGLITPNCIEPTVTDEDSATVTYIPPEKTYTVTYDGNGGSPAPVDGTLYEFGDTVTVMGQGILTYPGFDFLGWLIGDDPTILTEGDTFTMPAEDVTLVAQWAEIQPETYTVTYDGNGGSPAPVDSASYEAGQTVTVLGPGIMAYTGHHFLGWLIGDDPTLLTEGDTFVMPEGNVTLWAQWAENETYTVTYDGNGGSPAPADSASYEAGATVTVLGQGSMVYPGFTFQGWEIEDNPPLLSEGDTFVMPEGNVTLWAQWSENETYSVTYDPNGGSLAPVDSTLYGTGDTVTVLGQESMVYPGYDFLGWAVADGPTMVQGDTFAMPGGDVTLYAQWIPAGQDYAAIHLSKSVSDPTVSSRSATVTYTFSVTNNGTYPLHDVTITDSDIGMAPIVIGDLPVDETATRTMDFDLGTLDIGAWDSFENTATVTGTYYTNSEKSNITSDEDTATVVYSAPSRHRNTGTVVIPEPVVPAAPVVTPPVVTPTPQVVIDEPVPAAAAPLPKTGGLDPSFLYGLGTLLAGSGIVLKRRKK